MINKAIVLAILCSYATNTHGVEKSYVFLPISKEYRELAPDKKFHFLDCKADESGTVADVKARLQRKVKLLGKIGPFRFVYMKKELKDGEAMPSGLARNNKELDKGDLFLWAILIK